MTDQLALFGSEIDSEALICGVDEVGRGPLAGNVVAAAVILDPENPIQGLTDSKALSARRRDVLFDRIRNEAQAWAIAEATPAEIDRLNILQATLLAMQRAVSMLSVRPTHVYVDGNRAPEFGIPATAIVKGDALVPAISAASILAKVYRDRQMVELDARYPMYGFARHKGYPTREHLDALRKHGVLEMHRRSFGPVRKILESVEQQG
ncbi:MAG: ribonuclease HII [Gammaproteobacteria bacterium]|nr:MAG: ribonuclease HII [Gammaproteobacteria bacterium]